MARREPLASLTCLAVDAFAIAPGWRDQHNGHTPTWGAIVELITRFVAQTDAAPDERCQPFRDHPFRLCPPERV